MLRGIIVTVVKSTIGATYDLVTEGGERLINEASYQYDSLKLALGDKTTPEEKKKMEREQRELEREAYRARINNYRTGSVKSSPFADDKHFSRYLEAINAETIAVNTAIKNIQEGIFGFFKQGEMNTLAEFKKTLLELNKTIDLHEFTATLQAQLKKLGDTPAGKRLQDLTKKIMINDVSDIASKEVLCNRYEK